MAVSESEEDPVATLRAWLEEARAAGEYEPEAMTLATATVDGRPSARIVFLRGRGDDGVLRFFTGYDSRKGRELAENPWAAVVLHWKVIRRQVRVEGRVHRLPAEESDAYFDQRPKDSQLAASVSPQSSVIEGLAALERERQALAERLGERPVPRPERWGGFGLVPEVVELWRSGAARMHERRRFVRSEGGWIVEMLAP
jgi:pyridoxamine 5'-phosphate oxidase